MTAIVRDPEIRGGEAVIAGTRFPISQLIAEIAQRFRSSDNLDDLCYDLELREDAVIAALQELSTELQQGSGGA